MRRLASLEEYKRNMLKTQHLLGTEGAVSVLQTAKRIVVGLAVND